MRKLAFLLTLLLPAGVALAQEEPTRPEPGPLSASVKAMGGTKELAVQVVSTDTVAKTITVKKASPEGKADPAAAPLPTTLPVEAAAEPALQTVMPGDKVKLVVRTDSTGKETAVKAIEKKSQTDSPKP